LRVSEIESSTLFCGADARLDYGGDDAFFVHGAAVAGSHQIGSASRATLISFWTLDALASARSGRALSIPLFDAPQFRLLSELLGAERVAASNRSGFQPGHKPMGTLSRSTVGKCIGHDVSLGLPLQPVVSDG
jgi:hypothetical protein